MNVHSKSKCEVTTECLQVVTSPQIDRILPLPHIIQNLTIAWMLRACECHVFLGIKKKKEIGEKAIKDYERNWLKCT